MISTSFHSPFNSYFRSNHLGKRYTSHFWFRSLVPFLWDINHNAWLDYCNQIHSPDTTIRKISTVKSTQLHLVAKYILEVEILPTHKRLFFACKKSKYQSWLQNWLISARRILRRYLDRTITHTRTDTPVTTSQLNHNTHQPYQHISHRPPNNNHYTVSTITKFHPKRYLHMIPISIDLDLQKANNIPAFPSEIHHRTFPPIFLFL